MKYFVASILIIIFGIFNTLNPVRDVFVVVFGPIQLGLRNSALELKRASTFFINLDAIYESNQLLSEENRNLKSRIVDIKQAEEENALLREQLSLLKEDSFENQLLLADVLGNPNDPTGASILINKGSKHGIREGNNVILGKHMLGIVRTVFHGRSVVDLITSPNISITVLDIDSKDKAEGLVSGEFGTAVVMRRILPNEDVKIGDVITTTGRDGTFEPNFIIGEVASVNGNSAEPLRTATLSTGIDFKKLSKVFVLVF